MGEAVRLIDGAGLHLAGAGAQWAKHRKCPSDAEARFSADVCGAKAHVVHDRDQGCPIYPMVTNAKVNELAAAKTMPVEAGATSVFDLGYYDTAWRAPSRSKLRAKREKQFAHVARWAKLDDACCRIVTRFKKNTPFNAAKSMTVEPKTGVLSDHIGFLPGRQAENRKNPMQGAVREIVVTMQTGKTLRILSNDLDAPACEVAGLTKRRWQIELFLRVTLFLRVMKQTLKITHFIGRSENAVRIQNAVALIAFLLPGTLRKMAQGKHGLLELTRLARTNLMHRKDFTRLKQFQKPPPLDSRQLSLNWSST